MNIDNSHKRCLKLSPYVFVSNFDDKTDIATNLATSEVLQLTKDETNMLNNAIPDSKGGFEKSGFLVSDDKIIRQCAIERHRIACYTPVIFNLTLLPTLYCNFSCHYCFEKGVNKKRMDDEVINRVLKLVVNQAPYHLRTNLAWFGGEPLLEINHIADIHPKIRSLVLSNNCEFTSNITTNGYLLNQDATILMRDLDIKFVQITLDGDKEVHNKNRITKNCEGTFDRIFENMLNFLEIFTEGIITLRVNANYNTASSILEALKHIPDSFRNRVSVHLHQIMNAKCPNNFSNEFSELLKHVYRQIRALGFEIAVDHYLDPGPSVYCYAERASSAVIDPSGYVYKCAYTNFSEKERIGYLGNDGKIRPVGHFGAEWKKLTLIEPLKCTKCNYLPICGFGCPRLRLTEGNDFRCKNRFKFLPDTLVALVKRLSEN